MSAEARTLGIFSLGALQLALPLEALREVVPASKIHPYPSACPYVAGGVDIRGVLVPLIDLRPCLSSHVNEESQALPASVVVMAFRGQLIGLTADQAVGIFSLPPEAFTDTCENRQNPLIETLFAHPDNGQFVHVLTPERVMQLPDIPAVHDPYVQHRQSLPSSGSVQESASATGNTRAASVRRHVVLFRCGPLYMALNTDHVIGTVLEPAIDTSNYCKGYHLGEIQYQAQAIPAVDLARLMKLQSPPAARCAIVVKYPSGLAALMVDDVIDVLHFSSQHLRPVATGAFPCGELLQELIPASDMPLASGHPPSGYFIGVNESALLGLSCIDGLARIATQKREDSNVSAAQQGVVQTTQILSYDLGLEVGSHMKQVIELLPWREDASLFHQEHFASALLMNRDCAIPVYDLATLLGGPAVTPSVEACVMVVQPKDVNSQVGFIVQRLLSIEDAEWSRQISAFKQPARHSNPAFDSCWSTARVRHHDDWRLIQLLDLHEVARCLATLSARLAS